MQNSSKISLIKNIRSNIFIILISLIIIFFLITIVDRVLFIQDTKDRISNEIIENQSKLIKSEILTVSNMIYYYIEHYHNQNEILDYLRQVRFGEHQDGYIFVVSYDGTTLLNDTKRELEGVNIWDMKDPNGIKVIQEERKAAEKPGGDFIYYSWEQPSTGKITPKIAYVIGIAEWEWMVGSLS